MARKAIEHKSAQGIRTVTQYSDIVLDKIYVAEFQKDGTITAQLRQPVVTKSYYPSKKVESSMSQNLFGSDAFGFEEQEFSNTEQRVTWMLVPANMTEDQIKAAIAEANKAEATIYKVLSNRPILDENQAYAITQPNLNVSLDTFANSQAVRYPENPETIANGTAGQLCLTADNKVQYRKTYFWKTFKEDLDMRTADPADVYLSPEIKAELEGASVLSGQTL